MPLIPIDWLASHVEIPEDLTAAQLAADLVKVGLEEEEIHQPDVSGPIVVGKVLTLVKEPQKNGKLINYCRVDVGAHNDAPGEGKEPVDFPSRGIICGAHNFVEGDYVVVSLPGAVLPGNFAIAARKTYGHISDGMICSARELGLGEDHDGIIVLAHDDDEAEKIGLPGVGEDVLAYLGLATETLEINVTPDRGYCFSMRGVAREYSHSTGAKFTDPGLLENFNSEFLPANNKGFEVRVADENPIHGKPGADRFVTRIVRGVDPNAQSPKWMQDRLTAAGMRPISLSVDATNYVMLDLGQPLHAYDLAKVVEPLVVRRAHTGEKLTTLDGVVRSLHDEDLIIADSHGAVGARPVGLAGVMGGSETEIGPETTDILIEAAHFDPVSIARMARRHRLPSEASKRFERGVDPTIAPLAAQMVAEILVDFGGGTIDEDSFDLNTVPEIEPIDFAVSEVQRLTGLELPRAEVIRILQDIGCTVQDKGEVLSVTPAPWRPDLVGSAHFVEEIARLVGYGEIASVLPTPAGGAGLTRQQRQQRDIVRALAEQGWMQVLSYPFVSESTFDKQLIPKLDQRREAIVLANPLQEESPYMRTSVLDSLLETAKMNVARSNPAVAIFESSIVTRPHGLVPAETPHPGQRPTDVQLAALAQAMPAQPHHIGGVATPIAAQATSGFSAVEWDWRDALNAVMVIVETLGAEVTFANIDRPPLHPGRGAQASVNGIVIGFAGELAPKVCKAFDLPARSIAFEVDIDILLKTVADQPRNILPVSSFPAAKEDIALVVDEDLPAGEVKEAIIDAAGALLEEVRLFDVYTGDQIPNRKKSLAFALRLRGTDHTLTAEEAASVRKRIIKRTGKKFGAQLRG
ncbi:phenylalanine--tRNA ligase subunit beta [Arcanobacterium buesumense]|uniref:Phenylalanine--tRNA ligase beta subunit n=1 Tax=Arcanobacterium buesumense TaxID=2722751 RepID=A0A6H2ELG6_9ACTO|nr:phenylalanine--tRNA ligase subunit beta [Arcanobacterium buesumense]QJC21862.1 phenylalanine--tRNA ligase subunit beta [Arcanobacterium buesumense]